MTKESGTCNSHKYKNNGPVPPIKTKKGKKRGHNGSSRASSKGSRKSSAGLSGMEAARNQARAEPPAKFDRKMALELKDREVRWW